MLVGMVGLGLKQYDKLSCRPIWAMHLTCYLEFYSAFIILCWNCSQCKCWSAHWALIWEQSSICWNFMCICDPICYPFVGIFWPCKNYTMWSTTEELTTEENQLDSCFYYSLYVFPSGLRNWWKYLWCEWGEKVTLKSWKVKNFGGDFSTRHNVQKIWK